jgi:hypothetical protein
MKFVKSKYLVDGTYKLKFCIETLKQLIAYDENVNRIVI